MSSALSATPSLTLPDFPYPCQTVEIDGYDYAYVEAGDGPPVVLVHGNPTWSYLFRSLVKVLPRSGFRALAPDHIGMGRSEKPTAHEYPHTLARRISDFGKFMDHVAPEGPVSLVLHDWGGPIALGWAVEHPERINRIVLLNTAAFRLPSGKTVPKLLRLAQSWPVGPVAVRWANAFVHGAIRLGVRSPLPRPVKRGYLAPYDRPAAREAVLRFVQDIPTSPDAEAYAPLLRIEQKLGVLKDKPILICWGMQDFVFDARILARWEELLPDASVIRFESAGHFVLEDAEPALVELLPTFLLDGPLQGATEPGESA